MEKYDPFDIKSQDAAKSDTDLKARLAREIEEADFKWLMSSKRGRRIIWRLLDQAGVFQPVFHTVAMQMAFNEGNRNYGLRTLALVHEHCPELYPQMMKEQTNGKPDGNTAGRSNQ